MICDRNDIQTDFFLLRDGPVLVSSDRKLWQAGTHWLRDVRGYRCHACPGAQLARDAGVV